MVYAHIRLANPSISLATVYKTLESFAQKKLIEKVSSEDGNMRFDINTIPHNHIYCTNTQEIIDFQDAELQEILENFLAKKSIQNFQLHDFQLQISGEKIDLNQKVGF
jgi:Fur family transcriptional regulator, peroxide stress response regulator